MDSTWSTAMVGGAAVAVNALVSFAAKQRRSGAESQEIRQHSAWLQSHSGKIRDLEKSVSGHETRIAVIEARCEEKCID